ncbi:CBS domain-containing protein [Silanimonas sp.]|uniref:CBS domain-containing protein n=1 Tax=Silanimonas sp. TaxID=1929290 RepID=UPI001BC03B1D|nr:CBS domain-containing protein [Silanimonas sp.]MBS3897106.1 CBS domain-containing protein [Silanimonas sp.]MBS3923944.1 CBS domain-containing protein [Xanthomonadaceae bacterium]
MRSVRQILDGKDTPLVTVGPDDAVLEALKRMAEAGVGAVLVMDAGRLVGILTERDYARKVVLQGRASATTPVRAIMTSPVRTVGPEQRAGECMEMMSEYRFRHLPVVEDDVVLGVVSIGDLLKLVIEEQRHEIAALQSYIAS